MSQKVVIGLGFGDEGKGLVTDWLCSKEEFASVIRYSGGHQVGHCVIDGNKKHIFSNFGCGTMRGNPTFWNCKTADPVGFCKEYDDIIKIMPEPIIQIDPMCPITTPFDKVFNLKREEEKQHSTMGVGFAATIAREEANFHLYFQDLFYYNILKAKLKEIENFYKNITVDNIDIVEFLQSCKKMTKLVKTDLEIGNHTIYESSQGLMLDMDYGFFPYVTRSRLGTQEIEVNDDTEYYLVTRGYQTRHGNGYCSKDNYYPNAPFETNVDNFNQGSFKTKILDLDLLNYSINIDKKIRESNKKNLVITCLDQMNDYSLIHNEERKVFKNEGKFLEYIIENLPTFMFVYTSYGPEAKDMRFLS